ncbi:MAG: cell division protein ZapE [Alphaproteobacteria bacterium]|nr:cell division protein ZapE [Alphaproteobacteria bacterium]
MPGPLETYNEWVANGALESDPAQARAAAELQRVYEAMVSPSSPRGEGRVNREASILKRLLMPLTQTLSPRGRGLARGLYLWGGVGRGKSMLMDLFFRSLPDDVRKRRVHFHAFMIEVHDWLHVRRGSKVDTLLPDLAKEIAANTKLLCFDEFHVDDVADAMLLGRLFTGLFERGVVVVATSNFAPDDLYEGGLQRDRFEPFIALLKERTTVLHVDGGVDYRARCLVEEGVYFTPLGDASRRKADAVFAHLAGNAPVHEDAFEVKGRCIRVPVVAGGVARFTFAELCERPRGAEDYLAIAGRYHTVFIEGVPKMNYDRRNEAKRFMTLIDALYDTGTKLVVTADASPDKLYLGHDHAFEFERTVSRLKEMGGAGYLRGADL